MTVPFNTISPDVRIPLFHAEVDGSRAGTFQRVQPGLVIGHKLAAAPAADDQPVIVSSVDQAAELFGVGSMLHQMVAAWRSNDTFGELWALPVPDPAGTAATASVTITGAASANGVLPVYIGGRKTSVTVTSGDSASAVATALANAVNADAMRIADAAAATGTVTLTARHTGVAYDGTKVEVAILGNFGGEAVPAGLSVTASDFTGGAGAPDLTNGLAALGDDPYDFIALAYTDTASLDAMEAFLDGQAGRWSWTDQIYGHAWAFKADTLSGLATFGNTRNDPHMTVFGLREASSPAWANAAAFVSAAAQSLKIDPARPLQTLPVRGVNVAPKAGRFTKSERNTLLFDGIATATVGDDGTVRIERAITTYQQNAFGQPDNAWLDVTTPYTVARLMRRLRFVVERDFSRVKLADNGTPLSPGSATVTPNDIRNEIIAEYRRLEGELVENLEAFSENLVVERNANDPNRVDVLFAPDLVNQLRVFAVLAQFRLQYGQAA